VTNAAGWVVKDMSTDTTRDGWISNGIAVRYDAAQNMFPITDAIVGGVNASGGRFAGNYTNCNIEAIAFEVNAYGIPAFDDYGNKNNPLFYFHDGKRYRWIYDSDVIPCDTFSNWVNVTIPLSFSSNWAGECGLTGSDAFKASKSTVSDIGIQVQQFKNMSANQCAIRNIKLIGPWGGPFTNGVSLAWLVENGLDITNALRGADNFGRPLRVEFLACTDPNDSNDVFKVEISRNEQGNSVLKWKQNNKYAHYDLLEGTDLTDVKSFKVKSDLVSMKDAGGTQRVAEVDGSLITGPRYYRVQISAP